MIDRETWIILAERLAVIRWWEDAQRSADAYDVDIELAFDAHDQARIVAK